VFIHRTASHCPTGCYTGQDGIRFERLLPEVAAILALDGDGHRPDAAGDGNLLFPRRAKAAGGHGARVVPGSRAPEAALSGLWLYSCLEESHRLSQDIHTADGSFGTAMHRQEPDPVTRRTVSSWAGTGFRAAPQKRRG
jgi:hypothetical protein